ncbi:hypothetical protein LJB85_02215 [Porphyromonadaceae bacterium OttesenSCG-928-L07]|nr:hypothetical protein [Porphyromonadaceae bacterium OttesenSCG-928-L07]MDL2251985.1 hypothetical protein [Odoribacter sp. OttesenSCG-928-J03]MDL2330817.1 hypothetical protein [Odoribacter sp. OttesenSCG-928-A06]
MKKILLYLSTALIGALLLVACASNDAPEFSDSDAFVAFGQTSISFDENAGNVTIPVTLASLGGITTTASYEVIPGDPAQKGAVEGVNYKINAGSTTLTFTKENPTQYVELEIINVEGVFTGDLTFSVQLTNSGSVNFGTLKAISVKINDLDHPLASILGEFKANGESYFNGPTEWTIEILKDAEDVSKVWFSSFVSGGTGAGVLVYGNVDADITEIRVPVGQFLTASESAVLQGFDEEGEVPIPTGGNIIFEVSPDGKTITTKNWFGSEAASGGWYNIFIGATLTKN